MKFKSRLVVLLFWTVIPIPLLAFGLIPSVASPFDGNLRIFFICLTVILGVSSLGIISSLTITVNQDRIAAKRFGKKKWEISKTDISEIQYAGYNFWALLLVGDSATEVYIYPTKESRHKLQEFGLSKKGYKYFCFGASKRQVKKMQELGYVITPVKERRNHTDF